MTRVEERAVIDRVLSGEGEAFELLVLKNQRKIYNLCYRMTGNPEDASDLTQEAFLKAYQNLARFKGESSISLWMYCLASNACIDHLRREKRREKRSLTVIDETGEVAELELSDERFTPEGELERRQVIEGIEQGLQTLTEEHRQILILREINELSYDEIADILKLSAGTVKSRISRARVILRKFLLEQGNFSESHASKLYTQEKEEGR